MSNALVDIDGSMLEGGGQILRMALTLSALCSVPVRVYNIRAGRSKPGLMAQHLKGLKLLSDMSKASVKGAEIGSTDIEFWPQTISGGLYTADTQTAGSVGLLLQVALPCAYFANSETTLQLKGGTNAEMAPQIDYTTEVFRPILEKFNITFDFDLIRRGYYPKGGGEVSIRVKPAQFIPPVTLLEQGQVKAIYGWSFVAGALPVHVAHKMADAAVRLIRQNVPLVKVDIERYKEDPQIAIGSCSGIILVAETSTGCILGGSSLGKKNTPAETTGSEAAEELISSLKEGACVDQHSQDQIIIFMALAKGLSQVRIGKVTQHTETAIFVAEKLTKTKFQIVNEGSSSVLKCEGINLINNQL